MSDTPPEHAWKAHIGQIAWPTLLLAGAVVPAWLGVVLLHASGAWPTWVALPLNTLIAYAAFTPLHEATHGNVGGTPDRAWIDRAVGWWAGQPLLSVYPAFRAVHLTHHAHTNDLARDPDSHPHGPWWRVLWGIATIYHHYMGFYFQQLATRSELGRRALRGSVLGFVLQSVVFVGFIGAGYGWTFLFTMALPAIFATQILAVVFDWLPHTPHHDTRRMHDTRILTDRWLLGPFLAQNLHLIHHLWPRVPFYRYPALFAQTEDWLRDQGAQIDSLADLVANPDVRATLKGR